MKQFGMNSKLMPMSNIEDFYAVVSFLMTSARGLVDEPKNYGQLRLLEATTKLVDVLEARGLADNFLGKLKPRIEKAVDLLEDERQFVDFLDNMILDLVDQVKNQ